MAEKAEGKPTIGNCCPKNDLSDVAASTISRFGAPIDSIAYTRTVYTWTGSAALSAVVYGTNQLVSLALRPFTGAPVTNRNLKTTIIASGIGRGGRGCLELFVPAG